MLRPILYTVAAVIIVVCTFFAGNVAWDNAQARRCAAIKADLEVMQMCEGNQNCRYEYKDLHKLVHTFADCMVRHD